MNSIEGSEGYNRSTIWKEFIPWQTGILYCPYTMKKQTHGMKDLFTPLESLVLDVANYNVRIKVPKDMTVVPTAVY